MMRDYKFRGRRLDNQKWVYGVYMSQYHSARYGRVDAIFYSDALKTHRIPVDPVTVGQFTGIELDKEPHITVGDFSKVELFEGDIVRFSVFDYNGADTQRSGVVYWSGCAFWIDCTAGGDDEAIYGLQLAFNQDECMEIIGTIHDPAHD